MLLNRSRAIEMMTATGLDALVATSPPNIRYMTGFHCWLASNTKEFMVEAGGSGQLAQQNFALLPVAGDAALVVEPFFAIDTVELWVDDVRAAGPGEYEPSSAPRSVPERFQPALDVVSAWDGTAPIAVLAQALADRGLADGRIGVEFEELSEPRRVELRAALPDAELVDATNLLRLIRAVKTPAEIALLERAATNAEGAAHTAFEAVAAGASFPDLVATYRAELGRVGGDFDHFAIGPRGLGVSSHAGYTLQDGEVLFSDWGSIYDGYYSDTGTTICVGGASDEALERHAAIRACLRAGAAELKPGVLASVVQRALEETLREGGIEGMVPFGHGFGIEARDYPLLVRPNGRQIRDGSIDISSDLPLESGMVVNIEVPVFTPGVGSMQTEQSFVVTDTGYRALVDQPRDRPLTGR
jgi:Xaa-Pro dipeptidase